MKFLKEKLENYTNKRRGVYLLPNKWGVLYFFLVLTTFYIGISYANNILLTFSFFLFSYFLVLLVMAHFNLYGQKFSNPCLKDCFADQSLSLSLDVEPFNLFYPRDICLEIKGPWGVRTFSSETSVLKKGHVTFLATGLQRGYYSANTIKVSGSYPLGMFHCWKTLQQNIGIYVYPKRRSQKNISLKMIKQEDGVARPILDVDGDFFQHQNYQGESFSRIDWKAYARKDILLAQQFSGLESESVEIAWNLFKEDEAEVRLEKMAGLIEFCYQRDLIWSLRLPNKTLAKGKGEHHYKESMRSLSLYG